MQTFAIVPAAGRSVRMGQPKLLLPWGSGTIIERVLEVWRASRVSRVVVVVHPDDRQLAELARRGGAGVVVPDDAPPDMKASVGHALRHIVQMYSPSSEDAWLLAPADMPAILPATVDDLIRHFELGLHSGPQAPQPILVPVFDGKRGHPVLFPWTLAAEVAALEPDAGMNTLVARYAVQEVACLDAGTLADLDHPDEYNSLHNRYHPRNPAAETPRSG